MYYNFTVTKSKQNSCCDINISEFRNIFSGIYFLCLRMEIIDEIMSILPPLNYDNHKGQQGRIGIVGGSKNYTGAPYFAAISALKVGCDLAYVFCTKDASQVIKSYSPELIVHPILDSENFEEEISATLPVLHSLVIGPGLGREKFAFDNIRILIHLAKERDLPLVFDADALFYVNNFPEDVMSYKKAILTPNKMEFARLYNSVCPEKLSHDPTEDDVKELAKVLGNVTIVCKGPSDVISNGIDTVLCKEPGSARRCGGQGDLLSGAMGVFNFWAHKFYEKECACSTNMHSATILAAMAACVLTRRCNFLAFQKFQRSALTTNMISEIHSAFTALFYKLF